MTAWIVDADSHVTEAPDVWTARIPSRYGALIPRVERDPETGIDVWFINDEPSDATVGGGAVAGWPEPYPSRPRNLDEIPPGAWIASDRLAFMDSAGIWAQVLYPNVGGFGNAAFLRMPDPELRLLCVQAYNDWLVEWASADSRRLLPIMATPFWDVDASVTEIQRCAAIGHRGILFTGEPHRFGLPYFGDPHWDRFWAAAQDTGMPVSFHLGSGNMDAFINPALRAAYGAGAAAARGTVAMFLDNGAQMVDLLLSGVLPRFPGLQVVSVESGVGWVPFALEAVDHCFEQFDVARDLPNYEGRPSDYFYRQMFVCYFYERMAPRRLADLLGINNVMFETDYPHPICLHESVQETIDATFEGVDPKIRHHFTWANAARLYHVDEPA